MQVFVLTGGGDVIGVFSECSAALEAYELLEDSRVDGGRRFSRSLEWSVSSHGLDSIDSETSPAIPIT
jgi:hypothetical protein